MLTLEPSQTLTEIALGLIHTFGAVLTRSQCATRIRHHLAVLALGAGPTCTREATRNRITLATVQTRRTATGITGDDLITQIEAFLLTLLVCHYPQLHLCPRVSICKYQKSLEL